MTIKGWKGLFCDIRGWKGLFPFLPLARWMPMDLFL